MKEVKVWIVSEVFYPDETSTAYIMTAIAEQLGKSANIHVLCGPAGYGKIVSDKSELNNVKIHRLKTFNLTKDNIFFRLLRLLLISLGMFLFGLLRVRKTDKLFLVTNPAFSIPLFALLKKLKGFKFMILVHDVFPENLIPAKIIRSKKNFIYLLLKKIFNISYKQADKLFVLGRDMKEIMIAKKVEESKVTIIENWGDLDEIYSMPFSDNELINKHHLQDKIVFMFAGNLGRVQGLRYFFDVISTVNNPLVHFLFAGDGAMLAELKLIQKQKKMENVTFLGNFPRNQQNTFLNASHFGVVTLEEEIFGLGVPSKSYNILAAGKPIFFIGNKSSEIAIMIKENNCGVSFSMEETLKITSFMNNLNLQNIQEYMKMGLLNRSIAEENYSKDAILLKFKKEIIDAN